MVLFCTEDMTTGFRDAFTYCYRCKGRKVTLSDQEENDDDKLIEDFDYEHEVVVFQIRRKAMEKLRKKKPRTVMEMEESLPYQSKNEQDTEKEFCSVGSNFSECCLSDLSIEEGYMTAKTEFSKCSSLKGVEFENQWKIYYMNEIRKGSVIQEFCHCQGWPFGLGRKVALLPPLPKFSIRVLVMEETNQSCSNSLCLIKC